MADSGRRAASVAAALLLLGGGYLAGRSHLVGRVRDVFFVREAPSAPAADSLPDLPVAYDDTASYAELNQFLAERLDSTARAHAAWRAALASAGSLDSLRERLRSLLPPWSGPSIDPAARVHPWFETDSIEVSLILMDVPPGTAIWSVLARPRDADGAGPAVLFLPGNEATAEGLVSDEDYHHGIVAGLARSGFVVLAPLLPANDPSLKAELHLRALNSGGTLHALEQWQVEAVLDHLVSLPEVDSARVGLYGISAGGERALRLAALDPRPRAVVISGFVTDRAAWWFDRQLRPEHAINALPGMPEFFDDGNFLVLIHPRPLGIEVGEGDPRYAASKELAAELRVVYERSGQPERLSFLGFAGDHETSLATTGPFLQRWLNEN